MMHRHSGLKTALGIFFTAIMLFPVYWMVNISFTAKGSIRSGDLFPKDFTLDNYARVLDIQLPNLATSIILALCCVILTLLIALPSAYALSLLRVRGSRVISFLLIVAQMIPAVVVTLGFYEIYNKIGLLDTIPGLVLADSTIAVPFAVMLLTSFMESIPICLLEAAEVDGATKMRRFISIVIPLSRNSIVTVSLFAFLWAWSDFLFASTLDGGGSRRPITLGLYAYIGAQTQEWGPMMATAVLSSIPATILLVFAQKYVAAGVTAGAVKD